MKNFSATILTAAAVIGAGLAYGQQPQTEAPQEPQQQDSIQAPQPQPLTLEQMQQQIEQLQMQMTQLQDQQEQQQEEARKIDWGSVSGSVESNNIWYVPDGALGVNGVPPAERFGSNNYLKVDYSRGNFSAGMQFELYAPVLQGFSQNLQQGKIANKFVGWNDGNFNVTVGDFYEQFGNGIILRSWEDRALGFNNSLEGLRAGYSNNWIAVKGVLARPRLFMGYAATSIRGGDLSLNLSSLFKMGKHYLAIEGSYVNRFMNAYVGNATVKPSLNLYSARVVYDAQFGFSFKAEHVGKGPDLYMEADGARAVKGSAQLIEMSYNGHGLGVFVTARRLDHMKFKIDAEDGSLSNTMNYLPSLYRQYTYSLATLEPYSTEMDDEIGGQVDIFYNFARGTALGGKHGWKIHANFATFYPLEKRGKELYPLYRDLSFDLEIPWNRKFKTSLMYAVQTISPSHAMSSTTKVHNIFVLDMLAKFTRKVSMRFELQYLYARNPVAVDGPVPNGDWVAGLMELNVAPYFSFFVGDMYNYAQEKVHYYSAGTAVTFSRTRIALSYGRNRAGYVCSGGVCRFMPAYTGANIALTTSF